MALRQSFADEHPDLAKAALNVLGETKSWLISNPREAQAIVAAELDLPDDVVAVAWPKHDWSASVNAAMIQDIQEKANFLKEQGLVENKVDISSSFLWKP